MDAGVRARPRAAHARPAARAGLRRPAEAAGSDGGDRPGVRRRDQSLAEARSGAHARRLAADAATRARARVRPRRRALAVQPPGAALAVAAAPARGDGLEPGAILARAPAPVPA